MLLYPSTESTNQRWERAMYNRFESNDYTIIEGISGKDHEVPELDHWELEDFEDLVPQDLR
jgi:hypothetical protein